MPLAPIAIYKPVKNHGGAMTGNRGLVLHVQAGDNSPHDWFDNPTSQASSHFWVSKLGAIEQYMDTANRAWARADGNGEWISVETEGFPDQALTSDQVQALSQLYRWGHQQHGWPCQVAETPTATGFGWHGMGGSAWGGHRLCPGELRKAQRQDVLNGAAGTAPALPEDDMPDQTTSACVAHSGLGRWVLDRDGAVRTYNFDDSRPIPFHGSMYDYSEEQSAPGRYFVTIEPVGANDSDGYWIIANDGYAGKLKRP
jgi:N-acetylmuramoyl-L-alanine amidase